MDREDTQFLKRLLFLSFFAGLAVLVFNPNYRVKENKLSNAHYFPDQPKGSPPSEDSGNDQ